MRTRTDEANLATAAANSFHRGALLPARFAASAVAVYDAVGADADAALRTLGLTRAQLDDPLALVPAPILYQLLALACERDREFAVRAGASLKFGEMGLIDYVTASCSTLGTAIDAFVRFSRVSNPDSRYCLDDERGGAFLRLSYASGPPAPLAHMIAEFSLSLFFGRMREMTGRDVGVEVRFAQRAPAWEAALRDRFDCALRFDAPSDGILFTRASLAYPSRRADRRLESVVERYALGVLAADPNHETLADSVATAVRTALGGGAPTMRRVAKLLATSERTLRRRLAAEKLTFARLRDAELERLARELLRSHSSSIAEVAYLLGFSEARAFQRAFKRWTGVTPSALRAVREPRESVAAG